MMIFLDMRILQIHKFNINASIILNLKFEIDIYVYILCESNTF